MIEPFVEFNKMARLSRECIITEKIDGTNACICITDMNQMLIGSRSRWITPSEDNHGFARWATDHKEELLRLGPGRHFGEWWGSGIQRGYGLANGEKRFSLFNTIRWCQLGHEPKKIGVDKYQEMAPACCYVVPVLWQGIFSTDQCDSCLSLLASVGSQAAPTFMNPEGIVCYHIAGNVGFKKTLDKDGPKSL